MNKGLKIATIIGARPQFVKAATISRAISRRNKGQTQKIHEIIVHTGQHYDEKMSKLFFDEMNIPTPDYNLGLGGKSHGEMTGQMIIEIEKILLKENPDILLVYGDTNSTLAGAIAASKINIPIAHVEAGLRSQNMKMPEEINRVVTDQISKWLFCPTTVAADNLRQEGFEDSIISKRTTNPKIFQVGDVMLDAVRHYKKSAVPSPEILEITKKLDNNFILSTIHRAENTDDIGRLTNILFALDEISQSTPVILPMHPRTKKISEELLASCNNIKVIDPVGYFDMLHLLENCNAVMTDSGGLQKEAYFFKKMCVTIREETEWVELINAGANFLAKADKKEIVEKMAKCVNEPINFKEEALYGDGQAAEKILEILASYAE